MSVASLPPIPFHVWVAALASGYAPLADFIAWADARIMAEAHQPRWVLDLALAATPEQAESVLRLEWSRQSYFPQAFGLAPTSELDELHVGFLYLMFLDGRLSMAGALTRAGRYADGADVGEDCEAFYYLLNEIDGRGPTSPSEPPLAQRVAERFAPSEIAARAALPKLPRGPASP